MKRAMIAVLLGLTALCSHGVTRADVPLWGPPHGMFFVDVENNKIVSRTGAVDFSPAINQVITFNQYGQTILTHNVGGQIINPAPEPPTPILGGIAERTLADPTKSFFDQPVANDLMPAATAASTVLMADDPGFLTDAIVFPGNPEVFPSGYRLSVSFFNSLLYFDPVTMRWGAPMGEQLTTFDYTGADETGGNGDLAVTLDASGSGRLGTINLDITPVGQSDHSHIVYELRREDGGIPLRGAYMIELNLSAQQVIGSGGPVLEESDPLFILFNNRLDVVEYAEAVRQAKLLPEPSTVVMVGAVGMGLIGLRRRARTRI